MLTLTFERGVTGGQAGGVGRVALSVGDAVELARRSPRAATAVRRWRIRRSASKLVRFIIEDQGDRLTAKRGEIAALYGEQPNAIGLSAKLRVSEHRRRLLQFALSLQGERGPVRRRRGRSTAANGSVPISIRSPRRSAAAPARSRPTSSASAC